MGKQMNDVMINWQQNMTIYIAKWYKKLNNMANARRIKF